MKYSIAGLFLSQFTLTGSLIAGTPAESKNPVPMIPPAPAENAWEFTVSPYGWMAGLQGTTGIKGFNVETDVPFTDILSNLDMTAMLNLEARKGRWGGWLDGLYLKMSMGTEPSGPVFDSVGLSIEQVMAEAAVFYRVFEGDRGFLDLYAGARYVSVGGELSLSVSDSGVRAVSQELSQQLIDGVVSEVRGESQAALQKTGSKESQIARAAQDRLADIIGGRVNQARGRASGLREVTRAHPKLTQILRNSERLREALRVAAAAQRADRLAEIQQAAATASAAGAAARTAAARARSRAQQAVTQAEKKLAKELERALREGIPDEISGSAAWVDPFVGMRAQFRLTDRLYAIGKADIGGFGVSSDLVWQAYGALGYQLTKSGNTTLELGYKHMAIDYARGGFTYDVAMSGMMLNLGLKF